MHRLPIPLLACALATSGCSVMTDFGRFTSGEGADAGPAGMDAGPRDAGPGLDAGPTGLDGGETPDGGSDLDAALDEDASLSDAGPSCVPTAELCDMMDNDCDGMTDEDFDVATDRLNCGMCGNVCDGTHGSPSCSSGSCGVTCDRGWGDCTAAPGCETDLTTTSDCGMCGRGCSGGMICDTSSGTGVCTTTCSGRMCGSACVDTMTDPRNCGDCGIRCNDTHGTPSCVAGRCRIACDDPWGDCTGGPADGCETFLRSIFACGACGNTCPAYPNATSTCSSVAICGFTCNGSWLDCNMIPSDGCERASSTWYQDVDGDGYGVDATARSGCPATGWVARAGDCDDTRIMVNPGAPERCSNTRDDDCDGLTDEGCLPNDGCMGATDLAFGSSGEITGDFSTAAPGLDGVACTSGVPTEADLYFHVAVPESGGFIWLDTYGSSADTVLADEAGCPSVASVCTDSACGDANNGHVFMQIPAAPGVGPRHRYFSVRRRTGASAASRWGLHYQLLPHPNGASSMVPAAGSVVAGTTGASGSSASAYPSCDVMPDAAPEDVWYWTQCPGISRIAEVRQSATCPVGWNEAVWVRGPAAEPSLPFCTTGVCPWVPVLWVSGLDSPGLYMIGVDGWGATPNTGSYRLTLNVTP